MSVDLRTGYLRRVVASAVLPLTLLALTGPIPPHEQTSDAGCHQSAPVEIAVSPDDASTPGCDHNTGTACAAMLGCVVLSSALASVATRFHALDSATVVAPFANGALHGRLGFRPPTPPPNS